MKSILFIFTLFMAQSVFAGGDFRTLAECQGHTNGIRHRVQAVVFQNKKESYGGMIFLIIGDGHDRQYKFSYTRIDEKRGDDEYPFIYHNGFKMNFFVSDEDANYTKVYVDNKLIADKVKCSYKHDR